MKLPRFLTDRFNGFNILDFKEYLSEGRIEIHLEHREDGPWQCSRCGKDLGAKRGKYRIKLEAMPLMGIRCFVFFWRYKGHCVHCKKARSQQVEFISPDRPHLTTDYAWWIGRLCEVTAVSRVAEIVGHDEYSTWRLDLNRMKRMLAHYKIPKVKRISVDEVYARKKPKSPFESRDERFFTVVSDLDTHRVIWVSQSRNKNSLDQFFMLIGEQACKEIEVVATDQHDDYAVSVREFCPQATLVWDRFHIMQNFEKYVNAQRMQLHGELPKGSELQRLTRGSFKFLFLKKASRRTEAERTHIDDVLQSNEQFAKLEIIKERMLTFFEQPSEEKAKEVFEEIGSWIWQAGFEDLMRWYNNLEGGWETLKNYFRFKVTTSLSEGQNNVIKSLKRRAFGYRNMLYFRLKIMQVCGYLNSRYIATSNQVDALL